MPGATLPNMLITLPSLGGDEGEWDDLLNAGLSTIDEHDHTSDKGARITPAAMNINADLSFGGNALTELGQAAFTAVAALASGTKTLFVSSADNELYWRTNAGTNVKLTSGSSINTSLVGGILGDYASVGAEVAYSDADDIYTFKQQNTKPWARIASGEIRLYQTGTTETVYTAIAVDNALASSYTITLPAALPGSTTLMQMSASGVMSFSNSLTGNVSTTGTVTATEFKHTSSLTVKISAADMVENGGSNTVIVGGTSGCVAGWNLGNSTQKLTVPIQLKEGDVITAFGVYANKTSNTSTTIAARLYKVAVTGGTIGNETLVGAGTSSNANAPGAIVLSESGLNETVSATFAYYLMVGYTALVSFGDDIYMAAITFTRPS